jgi:hypothetical protein
MVFAPKKIGMHRIKKNIFVIRYLLINILFNYNLLKSLMALKTGLMSSFERTKFIGKISISVKPAAIDFSACCNVSSRFGAPEASICVGN